MLFVWTTESYQYTFGEGDAEWNINRWQRLIVPDMLAGLWQAFILSDQTGPNWMNNLHHGFDIHCQYVCDGERVYGGLSCWEEHHNFDDLEVLFRTCVLEQYEDIDADQLDKAINTMSIAEARSLNEQYEKLWWEHQGRQESQKRQPHRRNAA